MVEVEGTSIQPTPNPELPLCRQSPLACTDQTHAPALRVLKDEAELVICDYTYQSKEKSAV